MKKKEFHTSEADSMKYQAEYPFPIELDRKNIKNLYIRILPPDGIVRISAPRRMPERMIREAI